MVELKSISPREINRIRLAPSESGIPYQIYGKHENIKMYTDQELSEMSNGVFKDKKFIRTDGDYFVNLNDVNEIVCVLQTASYHKEPSRQDYSSNAHNHIKNIRTFYVKDYILVTNQAVFGKLRHPITNWLARVGGISKGRNNFRGLFSVANYEGTLRVSQHMLVPTALYTPIKYYINELFFDVTYHIKNFSVEGAILIHSGR